MKKISPKLRKILLGIVISIVAFVALVIIFISPITKYLIEKYDTKYLGREITLGWVYVNPFTGYAHLHNLKLYEAGGMDTVFFSANGVSINFAIFKAIGKTYEIENLTISKPYARIVQNRQWFNFNDIIEKFAPKDTVKKEEKPPVHFNLLDVAIEDGEFHYEERSIPVNYFVKNVEVSTPGMRWDVDTMQVKYALEAGPAPGKIAGDAAVNLKSLEYRVAAKIDKYDLAFIQEYIRDFSNYGTFRASLDGDIKAKGNAKIKLAVEATGWIAVNDFHFGKHPDDDYVAFKKLQIAMVDVNPRQFSYYIDTIMVDKPYFKYERYDNADNVSALFGKDLQNIKAAKADSTKFNLVIEVGKYVNDIINNFLKSYYKINRVAIYNGDIKFNDFALREQFAVAANPLNFMADSIDKSHKRMNMNLTTAVKPYGDVYVGISLDPNNYGNFSIRYNIEKIPLPMFNPYVLTYTSFPLDRGTLQFTGSLNAVDSNLQGENHLLILDPRVGKRLKKHQDATWIPVPLILSFVKDRSGVIDFSVPIRGNLSDPKFKLKSVILDVVRNIFVKPVTSPYIFHVKDVEKKIEKYLVIKWRTRYDELQYGQERFLDKMNDFLTDNPQAQLQVSPQVYTDKEKEYILFFEAKKKYALRNDPKRVINPEDSLAIDRMSIKDSTFVHYLDGLIKDKLVFTIQEKCRRYVGDGVVEARFAELMKSRRDKFLSEFDEANRSRVHVGTPQTIIPQNGFSYYRVEYKGDIPEKLRDSYDEIVQLNDENPRKPYQRARRENGGVLKEIKGFFQGHKKKDKSEQK